MVWDGTEDTDVYIINLNDGDVVHLNAEPMYALHHANAYRLNKVNISLSLNSFVITNYTMSEMSEIF